MSRHVPMPQGFEHVGGYPGGGGLGGGGGSGPPGGGRGGRGGGDWGAGGEGPSLQHPAQSQLSSVSLAQVKVNWRSAQVPNVPHGLAHDAGAEGGGGVGEGGGCGPGGGRGGDGGDGAGVQQPLQSQPMSLSCVHVKALMLWQVPAPQGDEHESGALGGGLGGEGGGRGSGGGCGGDGGGGASLQQPSQLQPIADDSEQ